jgi:hypothetical protein
VVGQLVKPDGHGRCTRPLDVQFARKDALFSVSLIKEGRSLGRSCLDACIHLGSYLMYVYLSQSICVKVKFNLILPIHFNTYGLR